MKAPTPVTIGQVADDVNRAKAIVQTVWLALHAPDLDQSDDLGEIGDTLYEALARLKRAESNLRVYSCP